MATGKQQKVIETSQGEITVQAGSNTIMQALLFPDQLVQRLGGNLGLLDEIQTMIQDGMDVEVLQKYPFLAGMTGQFMKLKRYLALDCIVDEPTEQDIKRLAIINGYPIHDRDEARVSWWLMVLSEKDWAKVRDAAMELTLFKKE